MKYRASDIKNIYLYMVKFDQHSDFDLVIINDIFVAVMNGYDYRVAECAVENYGRHNSFIKFGKRG